ncbi:uncharacterized protein TNCV_3599421 [Trichonephila clavipes]|nr:uncharacterized protein TNCV_3599421 [Trichonephila clavipes]
MSSIRLPGMFRLSKSSYNRRVEYPRGGQGLRITLPLSPALREDLRLDDYLEYPPAAKALYILKPPCLLWDSNPSPTAQQSASLASIPDGRTGEHVIVIN